MLFISKNPASEVVIFSHEEDNLEWITEIAREMQNHVFVSPHFSMKSRQVWLNRLAELLEERLDTLSLMITQEMGKPIAQSRGEVQKCALLCRYYAKNGANFLATELRQNNEERKTEIWYQPLGVILAIMPWNFPFWQVFRCAIPAVLAGNAVLLKHAPNVSLCALAIQKLFEDAGVPSSRFRAIFASNETISQLLADPFVAAVTVTGSTKAGSEVGKLAGEQIKPMVLELGGSDPYLILPDANIALAAQKCAASRLLNNGQSCIAAKRFLVYDSCYDAFLEALTTEMRSWRMGNPENSDTQIGPMARSDLRESLHRQVTESIAMGAVPALGCELPAGKGYYYPASILTGVSPDMPAGNEELFGPVAAVLRVSSDEEALQLANNSVFGLGAGIFTENHDKALALARELQAGSVTINDFVKSDPEVPFGGIKKSGIGRELSGEGIREFVNIKTVSIAK